MHRRRRVYLLLGTATWTVVVGATLSAVHTVRARATKATRSIDLHIPATIALKPGDAVYLATDAGLRPIGEVTRRSATAQSVTLAIEPSSYDRLNESTTARCRQTPLTIEQAIDALLPPQIQREVAERIAADWAEYDEQLSHIWSPLIGELAAAYLTAIGDDIEASIRHHERELWAITQAHGESLMREWPTIQEHLQPILQQHLNPVLGRLMNDALSAAPKVNIAWDVARGRNSQAFHRMLDWLTEYLVAMPDADKKEMTRAISNAWEAARADPVLIERFTKIGRGVIEDARIRTVLTNIYREAIADNPRTADFVRREVLESPRVRRHLYALLEAIGPTARRVAATVLFDGDGGTRPEIAHLVRYIALRRKVAWVTLETTDDSAKPLQPGATLHALPVESNE